MIETGCRIHRQGRNMTTVKTADLEYGMLVRYPSSTVWRVSGKKPAPKDGHGDRWEITLTHGRQERSVTVWDWFGWILASACAPTCRLTGEHTGR